MRVTVEKSRILRTRRSDTSALKLKAVFVLDALRTGVAGSTTDEFNQALFDVMQWAEPKIRRTTDHLKWVCEGALKRQQTPAGRRWMRYAHVDAERKCVWATSGHALRAVNFRASFPPHLARCRSLNRNKTAAAFLLDTNAPTPPLDFFDRACPFNPKKPYDRLCSVKLRYHWEIGVPLASKWGNGLRTSVAQFALTDQKTGAVSPVHFDKRILADAGIDPTCLEGIGTFRLETSDNCFVFVLSGKRRVVVAPFLVPDAKFQSVPAADTGNLVSFTDSEVRSAFAKADYANHDVPREVALSWMHQKRNEVVRKGEVEIDVSELLPVLGVLAGF